MNNSAEQRPCSITNCSRQAVHHELAQSDHWSVTIYYCDEHQREIDKGVPVGPVGIDNERVLIESLGTVEMQTGGVILGA